MASSVPPPTLTSTEYYKCLDTKDAMTYAGVRSRATLWDYINRKLIPKPSYSKTGRPTWLLGEVLEHTQRWKNYDAAPRGFKGDETIQNARAPNASPKVADRWKKRFGFGENKDQVPVIKKRLWASLKCKTKPL